jgi:hypothetical protein
LVGDSWQEPDTLLTPALSDQWSNWSRTHVDLTAYAGKTVRVAFLHQAGCAIWDCRDTSTGWYIDEVEIWRGVPTFNIPEGFELGSGDWSAESGIWQAGVPTGGAAQEGTKVLATILDGNYPGNGSSRFISPVFVVPVNNPRLRFWQAYSYSSSDSGSVQISVFTDGKWQDWVTLATPAPSDQSSGWSPCRSAAGAARGADGARGILPPSGLCDLGLPRHEHGLVHRPSGG